MFKVLGIIAGIALFIWICFMASAEFQKCNDRGGRMMQDKMTNTYVCVKEA